MYVALLIKLLMFPQIFALLPWADIIDLARRIGLESDSDASDIRQDLMRGVGGSVDDLGMETHCNPKFPKTCVTGQT